MVKAFTRTLKHRREGHSIEVMQPDGNIQAILEWCPHAKEIPVPRGTSPYTDRVIFCFEKGGWCVVGSRDFIVKHEDGSFGCMYAERLAEFYEPLEVINE